MDKEDKQEISKKDYFNWQNIHNKNKNKNKNNKR